MPSLPPTETLNELLHRVFGHREFRPHQQQVCEAAASGRDVLLVMPTGAGKSLCYQLPALARGGTGLVISPLIALMDDQASKLSALGLRVARVHSGLSREDARQACRDYLAGDLDFLFIAPERMRVPGFPEMLAKRKPALVAIDEAHCISQWGHDFRPDYRTLGQHLPALRPSPIIALTATATPAVQKDIALQLNLQEPAIFITGFRRENLAVQALELSKPQRAEYTAKLLADAGARPAIVYASSRKSADELATLLNKKFPAKAYHAGLEAAVRERVAREFATGKLDVVVATIAFGMGVDKADVRTVVHVALPGSVEAYYQEIGRAGRDGQPSRTVLLYSFADRKVQEFFLERNYPAMGELERVARTLEEAFVPVDSLQKRLKIDRETLERSLEKLAAQGVATFDMNGDVRGTGETPSGWKKGYEAQVAFRRSQIDKMVAFAEGHECRMAALVRHFGDMTDKHGPCGRCDACNPSAGQNAHAPDADECTKLRTILKALENRGQSTGKLFTDLALTKDRKDFDALLDGLARAALISIANETFTNPEGKEITYRKAAITHEGRTPDDATLATVWLHGESAGAPKKKTAKARARDEVAATPAQTKLEEKIRAWRIGVAKASGAPAFTIFADSVMRAIAVAEPRTISELRTVKGLGPAKIERYGAEVITLVRGEAAVPAKQPIEESPRSQVKPEPRVLMNSSRQAVVTSAIAKKAEPAATELSAAQKEIEEALRTWRLEQARQAGLPSFFIFSDTVLRTLVLAPPKTIHEFAQVRGFGTDKIDRYGQQVLTILRPLASSPA